MLTFINLLFIVKTRTLFLYLIATLLLSPILDKNTKKKTKLFFSIIVCIIIAIVIFGDIIPYVNLIIKNDAGIQVRFSAIDYYLNYFKSNSILGSGFVSSNLNSYMYLLVNGPLGQYNPSDVGIVGLMFRSGTIGLIWIILWFMQCIRIIRKNGSKVPKSYRSIMNHIIIFLLLSCINLIVTDNSRFPYISLAMIIIESSYIFINKKESEENK